MLVIVGLVVVMGCVPGGYVAMGGKLAVLMQPFELVIIGGAGLGAFIIGNTKPVMKRAGGAFKSVLKGPKYTKADYVELLCLLYTVFRLAKTKGMLELEQHVENPHESQLFNNFPRFAADHHAVEFLCDYLRLLTLGSENPQEMESLMDAELETHHEEDHQIQSSMQTMADGFPALGIVAAVLGVIKTMGSIDQPPSVLGKLIGGALVGTFLGILLAYGFFGPVAAALKMTQEAESKYLGCIKGGMLAYLNGYPPAVAVEFARKALMSDVRPTFAEVEEATQEAPTV